MQNRSNRGLAKPGVDTALQARVSDWDPIQRIALGPAAMCAALTGRTHVSTRPICKNVNFTLAKREPSTHVHYRWCTLRVILISGKGRVHRTDTVKENIGHVWLLSQFGVSRHCLSRRRMSFCVMRMVVRTLGSL